jgi:hypothetical protein
MASRPIETGWPALVDSTGQPGTGTRIDKAIFDEILDALKVSLYDASLDEGPPEIAGEVTTARGVYANLSERLAALEALASGGLATAGIAAGVNLVPNGNFLMWPDGKTAAPAYFAKTVGLTTAWLSSQSGYVDATKIPGPYRIQLSPPAATDYDLSNDLVTATDLSTFGAYPLSGRSFSAGVYVKSGTTGAIQLILDDGAAQHVIASNSGSASWEWISGSAQLSASPSKLTVMVRTKAAVVSEVAGLMVTPGDSGAPNFAPPMMKMGNMVMVFDGIATDGTKVAFYPAQPLMITSGRGLAQNSGTGDYEIKKSSADVFTGGLNFAASADTGEETAIDAPKSAFDPANKLEVVAANTDGNLAGVTLRLKTLQFVDPWPAIFAGRVVLA